MNQRTNNALIQSFAVNNLNELSGASRSGTLTVAGTATEPLGGYSYWGYPHGVTNVTVNTTSAAVYLDGTFAATNFTPANGANSYTAIAHDTYGRWDTNSVTVNLPASPAYGYDLNGNLTNDGTRSFAYDCENQLVGVWVASAWSNSFVYDGMLRKRIERDYAWNAGTSSWQQTNEIHFIFDGNLVLQERDGNNIPQATYTRGNDLSGDLQDAGGIGGLLARTDNSKLIIGDPFASAYYFFDGNGNVAGMVYTNGLMAAQYNYDPFGNMNWMSGPLAGPNKIRFSSKEWNDNAGLYYYGCRFYDPNLQRWLNRDPIQEQGGMNLYGFDSNNALSWLDPLGYCDVSVSGAAKTANDAYGRGETLLSTLPSVPNVLNGPSDLMQEHAAVNARQNPMNAFDFAGAQAWYGNGDRPAMLNNAGARIGATSGLLYGADNPFLAPGAKAIGIAQNINDLVDLANGLSNNKSSPHPNTPIINLGQYSGANTQINLVSGYISVPDRSAIYQNKTNSTDLLRLPVFQSGVCFLPPSGYQPYQK